MTRREANAWGSIMLASDDCFSVPYWVLLMCATYNDVIDKIVIVTIRQNVRDKVHFILKLTNDCSPEIKQNEVENEGKKACAHTQRRRQGKNASTTIFGVHFGKSLWFSVCVCVCPFSTLDFRVTENKDHRQLFRSVSSRARLQYISNAFR